jgi:NitT/TauT family transport system substrate-binding protein
LAQGQIDGYCVAEPFGAKAVTLGVGKAIYESNELWHDSICCSLVLTDDFIKNRPEAAKAFAAQYRAAGEAIAFNRADATLAAEKYLSVDTETLALSLQWIKFDKLEITEEAYGDLTDKMVRFGLSENPPKYEDFVANLD